MKKGMSRPQIRVMLDYLGVPFAQQGRTAAETKALLELTRQKDPAVYDQAYNIICLHQKPGATATPKESAYEELGRFLTTELSEGLDTARKQSQIKFDADAKLLLKQLIDRVHEATDEKLEEVLGQFRRLEVRVGDDKPRAVEGTMPEQFEQLLQLAQQRINILMVGPAGCGKTFIAGKVAEALGLDFASQSCTAGMSESQLTGWLLPIGDSGRFSYVSSEFIRLYENGGVFLLDELDASDPNVLLFINQALANGRFSLPHRFDNPTIVKHKDFVAVGAANTYGGGADALYHARNSLDASTLDRFKVGTVAMEYSEAVERSIGEEKLVAWAWAIRSKINQHKLRKVMSTRIIEDGTTMMRGQNWALSRIAQAYFSDWSKEERKVMGNKLVNGVVEGSEFDEEIPW